MSVVGKVHGFKIDGSGDKAKATFRLAVPKRWVSDDDKKDGKTQTFMPFVVYGKTAEWFDKWIVGKSDYVWIQDYEYFTYLSKKGEEAGVKYDDSHMFKAHQCTFAPGVPSEGGGSKDSGRDSGRSGGDRNRDRDSDRGRDRDDRGSRDSGRDRGRDDRKDDRDSGGSKDNYSPNDDLPF